MRKSFTATMLMLSLALGTAAPAAVWADEIGPGIGLEERIAAQQAAAQGGEAATETAAAQAGETAAGTEAAQAEVQPAGTSAAENTAVETAAASGTGMPAATPAAGASGTTASIPRKSAEELQAAMASTPAGPAKAEWGTFFLGNNLPPRNDEEEPYLRAFHAYAMVPTQEKYVYLTFDEGYENGYTPAILDVLKKHNIKAAFFCTGSFVRDNPELIKRFADEGHIIGNHTLTHPSMMKVGTWDEFSRQLFGVEERVQAITGKEMPRYYRPPAGAYSEAQLRMADALGFSTIFWSVAYKDWDVNAQPTHERAMNYLTTRIHPGAIILLHAVSRTNTEIMDQLLTTWEQMGYSFRTLDELPLGLTY